MPSSLHDPVVSRLLDALHSQADTVDAPLLAQMGDQPDHEMAHLLDQAFIPVSPDGGCLLYTLARAIQMNTQFLIRSPHPRNAQLWARWRMLPPDASLGELLAGWGDAYNLRRGDNAPDPLVAVRLDEFQWPYVHFGDFEQHKASWRVQLTP